MGIWTEPNKNTPSIVRKIGIDDGLRQDIVLHINFMLLQTKPQPSIEFLSLVNHFLFEAYTLIPYLQYLHVQQSAVKVLDNFYSNGFRVVSFLRALE